MYTENIQFIIHSSDFAKVGASWSRKVFHYPHNILYYVTKGSATINLNAQSIQLKEGYIYMLPGASFIETICEDSLEHFFIHFQAKVPYYDNVFDLYNHPLSIQVHNKDQLIDYFQIIGSQDNKSDIGSYCYRMGALQMIIAPFFNDVEEPNKEVLRFIDLLTYIDVHFHEKIYMKELADFLSLETTYFSHLFTETFGLSPKQHIVKKRIERGQLLLTQTKLKIKEIALQIGFDNEMYFCRLFRKKTGMTPGEYRNVSLSK